jgi:hypothetical protein
MEIAVIDNSIDPSVYHPIRHWQSYLKRKWQAFRAPQGFFPNLEKDYSHLILTGSEASILEREDWVRILPFEKKQES